MDQLKVSIVVPVYNSQEYLDRCLDSLLNQTYLNLEIILIDDGSADQSGDICDRYALKDRRIRCIHQQNQGVSCARNMGLDRATGDCVLFVDSDDWVDLDMVEKMTAVLTETGSDLVICDCLKEWKTESELYSHPNRAGFYRNDDMLQEHYPRLLISENLEYPLTISNCLILYRFNETRKQVRYIPGVRFSEDWLFGAELMLNSESFYYMKDEALYHYNLQNETSATHRVTLDKWNDYKTLYSAMNAVFGTCQKYDFRDQLNKVLLFLVWNSVGEILGNTDLNIRERKRLAYAILDDDVVREAFYRLRISKLPVRRKLKCQTYLYKTKIGLGMLARYLDRKSKAKD